MFYFAYGSNMNHKQMKERCPKSHFVGRAILENYKFIYDGLSTKWNGAVANIVESEDDKVWGGLFEIDENCLSSLDYFEGYPKVYCRKKIEAKGDDNMRYNAWAYLRTDKKTGEPSEKYRDVAIRGAHDCGLPEDYLKIL